MKRISYFKITSWALYSLLLIGLGSCQKAEFMPPPVGEELPAPAYKSLIEALPEQASLFKTAWQKADMETIVTTELGQAKTTFLVPNNTAMEAAGFTAAKIQTADKASLQKVLRYHVLNGNISIEQLKVAGVDLIFTTLLKHPKYLEGELRDRTLFKDVPYGYRHQLNTRDGKLVINGKPIAVDKELDVAQGKAFLVDKVFIAPEDQMYDFLVKDGRFSLFLKAMELNNVEYENELALNWFVNFFPPMRYLTDWNYHFPSAFHSRPDRPRHIIRFTLFAPTDAAFQALAINNTADLEALNNRIPTPYYYDQDQRTPIDSLLRYHQTARPRAGSDFDDEYLEYSYNVQVGQEINAIDFYTNMLNDKILANYMIQSYTGSGNWIYKYPEHRFNRTGDKIKVGHINSKDQNATIIEEDINTIQGPVHVVDRIIVPKDFSMWHKK